MVGVGPVGAGELASSNHLVTYTSSTRSAARGRTHAPATISEVQSASNPGPSKLLCVCAWRVELTLAANSLADAPTATPAACTLGGVSSSTSDSESLAANGRVCIKVDATKDDADDYVGFHRVRHAYQQRQSSSTSSRPSARTIAPIPTKAGRFNDAHYRRTSMDYVDYLTFFADPELRPAEGETASLSLAINVAYHHVATAAASWRSARPCPSPWTPARTRRCWISARRRPVEGDAAVDATLTL